MKYLVMECHPAYVVVLDEKGRFLKAANLNYEVGQTVTDIVPAKLPGQTAHAKHWTKPLVTAACVCLVLLMLWQVFLMPYGTVRMTINPDVRLTVNRLNQVIDAQGLNNDGVTLLQIYNYQYRFKTIEQVADDLTDRAIAMNYLNSGGTIQLRLESEHDDWIRSTSEALVLELEIHTDRQITIIVGDEVAVDVPAQTTAPAVQTVPQSTENTVPSETARDDDEDDDDDDDDRDDDDDDNDDDD